MPVKSFSTTAGSNGSVGGVNISENNLTPPNVNNALRALMADIRSWYEDAQFLDFSHSPTFATTTRFRLVGYGNLASIYHKGRRLRLGDASVLYGTITDATHSADTAITMALDTGALSASLSSAAVAILTATNHGIPTPLLLGDGSSDSPAFAFQADPDTGLARLGANNLGLIVGGALAVNALSDGALNYPLQPSFQATNSGADSNVTGAGTTATLEFDTETFDQGGDYDNATDTFTAPVAGRYLLGCHVLVGSLTAAMTFLSLNIVTSNRSYLVAQLNPGAIRSSSDNLVVGGMVLADMDAGDTATVTLRVANGAGDTASVSTSRFFGQLVA